MKTIKKSIIQLNSNLVSSQNLNDIDIGKIKTLHTLRQAYYCIMDSERDIDNIKRFAEIITQIDFQLQKLWKFPQDKSYHRFWELPHCDCPKLDNIEVYGTGHRYINSNCIIHS